ncbi:MAG: family 16 glycosylhydrolase [Verrucomicrobiota bacterium]
MPPVSPLRFRSDPRRRVGVVSFLLSLCLATGCSREKEAGGNSVAAPASSVYAPVVVETSENSLPLAGPVTWAVNVGGDATTGVDGIPYLADDPAVGGRIGQMEESAKGSQDNPLYQTYRVGDLGISRAFPNGVYDLLFRFVEPLDTPVGERVFTVLAQGKPVIEDLDVRLARDGKPFSALDRVAAGVEVTDGQLEIAFQAIAGEPVLSALVIRSRPNEDRRAWELVWSDEFENDGAPDATRWSIDVWPARKVNDEDQTYTDRPKNVRVENGRLILEAHKEAHAGAEYTSGRIHSMGKGDLLYGKVEVRARLPRGQGTWPAIWMLPSDPFKYATSGSAGDDWQGSADFDAWPNSGEIDIMEHVGYDLNTVHGTVHNKAYYWLHWNQRKGSIEGKTVADEFHVYSLEWFPDQLTISMDGTPYFTYVNDGKGWQSWPYDHSFHLILNLAVGGMWGRGGGPIDDSIFPARLEIDYVRFYQLAQP